MSWRPLYRTVAAATVLIVLSGVMDSSLSAAFKRVARGDRPPAFTLIDIDGKKWESDELLSGRVSVVVFWANWSPRSREILADLEKLRAELAPKRFEVIAVNAEHTEIDSYDQKLIRELAKELSLSARILLDQGLVVYDAYGTMALPSSLLVDEKGIVVFDLAGYPTTMRSDLSDAVKKALGLPTSLELRPPEMYVPKNHALMYFNFGKRLMEKGQGEKAEEQLLKSVERDPDFTRPRVMLGIYYKRSGRLEEALEQFQKVRELDPLNAEAMYESGAVSLRSGKFTEAEALFKELSEEFPEREEFALGLALSHKYQGDEERYRKAKELASKLFPAEPRIHYELGGIAEAQGDLEEAAPLYRRALEKTVRY